MPEVEVHDDFLDGPRPEHRQLVFNLDPGCWIVQWPGSVTADSPEPFFGARSPDGRWRVVAHFHLPSRDGRFFFRDLDITSWDGHEVSLGTEVLRSLPLGRWLTEAHTRLSDLAEDAERGGRASEPVRRLARSKAGAKQVGPRGFGHDFYRRVALAYLAEQKQGERGIYERLMRGSRKRFGRRIEDPEQMRDVISKATRLGLLGRGSPGRAGRLPGPNLYLDEESERQ